MRGYVSQSDVAETNYPSSVDLYSSPRVGGTSNFGNYSIPILDVDQPSLQATPSAEAFHLGAGTGSAIVSPHDRCASGCGTGSEGAVVQGPQFGAFSGYAAVPPFAGGDGFENAGTSLYMLPWI